MISWKDNITKDIDKWSHMGRGPSRGDQQTRMEELDYPIC